MRIQNKKIIPALSLILLLVLCIYSYTTFGKTYVSVSSFLANPHKFDNVSIGVSGKVINKTNNYFYLSSFSDKIMIHYKNAEKIKINDLYSVKGVYNKKGYIEAKELRKVDFIYLKYFLSFLGFIYFLHLLLRQWKISGYTLSPKGADKNS